MCFYDNHNILNDQVLKSLCLRIKFSSLLSLVDLAPTFLKVAGIDIPTQMQGVDQTDVFYGKKESIRSHIFVENRHNPRMPHLKTYINDNYKISIYREANYGELFDLENDPNEYNNFGDQ